MRIWKLAIVPLFVALFVTWYVFRPEGLYVDHRVQEEFP
jgi:hypothetical protein